MDDCLTYLALLTQFVKKHGRKGAWLISPYIPIVKLQTSSRPKPLDLIQPNYIGMFLGWSFLKIAKRNGIHEELWLPWQPIEKTKKINIKVTFGLISK